MATRTSISPLQTNRTSSKRLCWATGTSFSTFGSRSKNWWRLRKMMMPTKRKMITASVNAIRSAGTPACSIAAIIREIFALTRRDLSMRPIGCHNSSVGFFDATEEGIAAPPSGVNAENESLAILASFLNSVPRQRQIADRSRKLFRPQSIRCG